MNYLLVSIKLKKQDFLLQRTYIITYLLKVDRRRGRLEGATQAGP